jgi:quercetin dioxygenase-like cupin family protein
MKTQPFVLTPDLRERELNVLGTQITLLAPNALTKSFGITLQQGEEGTGPPPHSHDWDEAFYVLRGEIEFLQHDKTQLCTMGTLVFAPRGTVHGFRYGKGGGQMLEITGQGSGASETFTAINNEIPAGPPDFAKVLDVLARNGVTVAG